MLALENKLPPGLGVIGWSSIKLNRAGLAVGLFGCSLAYDLDSLWTLASFFNAELDALAFFEVAITLSNDGRIVNKNIFLAVVGLDKTIAFDAAEPLNRTVRAILGHWVKFLLTPHGVV